MSDISSTIGGLLAGAAAAGTLALAWRRGRSPFGGPALHTIERGQIDNSAWAMPSTPDFSAAPPISAGPEKVQDWLRSKGGVPLTVGIRSVLFAGNSKSIIITGLRPTIQQVPGRAKSWVFTSGGGDGYLHRRADVQIEHGEGDVKLFDENENECESLGVNLNSGDALEIAFLVESEDPGVIYSVSLELDLLVDGKPKRLPVDSGRKFNLAKPVSDAPSEVYPGVPD